MNLSTFSVELKVLPLKSLWLPVVTGGAEPKEGGGVAWAWIEDLNVYPGIPMLQ